MRSHTLRFLTLLVSVSAFFGFFTPTLAQQRSKRLSSADQNSINNSFRWAAFQNRTTELEKFYKLGAEIDSQDSGGNSALHLAALMGGAEAIKKLIAWGADVNLRDRGGQTPLHRAADCAGNVEIAIILLNADSEVNASDNEGKIPLHLAAFFGHTKIVDELLRRNSKPNALDHQGNSPLLRVSAYGDSLGTVETLLEQGADPILQNIHGESGLDFVSYHPQLIEKLFNAKSVSDSDSGIQLVSRRENPGLSSDLGVNPEITFLQESLSAKREAEVLQSRWERGFPSVRVDPVENPEQLNSSFVDYLTNLTIKIQILSGALAASVAENHRAQRAAIAAANDFLESASLVEGSEPVRRTLQGSSLDDLSVVRKDYLKDFEQYQILVESVRALAESSPYSDVKDKARALLLSISLWNAKPNPPDPEERLRSLLLVDISNTIENTSLCLSPEDNEVLIRLVEDIALAERSSLKPVIQRPSPKDFDKKEAWGIQFLEAAEKQHHIQNILDRLMENRDHYLRLGQSLNISAEDVGFQRLPVELEQIVTILETCRSAQSTARDFLIIKDVNIPKPLWRPTSTSP